MKPTLIIMAAGMGNRYGGLKQLDKVGPCRETIMDYSVYNAIAAGFGKIVFVIRNSFLHDFQQQVLSKYEHRIECHVVFQEVNKLPKPYVAPEDRVRPWGTNHALMMAKEVVNEPFCVINADDYYGKEAFVLMANALSSLPQGCTQRYFIVCYTLGNTLSESGTVSRGVCKLDAQNNLQDVVEYRKLALNKENGLIVDEETNVSFKPEAPVSMNFWGFTPDYFAYSEKLFVEFLKEHINEEKSEFYIPSVVSHLINAKQATFHTMQTADQWFGVTYAEDRPEVVTRLQQLHQQGHYPSPLFS